MLEQMESASALQKIELISPSLTTKEKAVGNYILKHPEKIIHMSITEFAENLNVAEATIFRLCKRLGYKGYQSLKIALASDVVKPIQNIHEEITYEDDVQAIAHKVFKSNIEAIEGTLSLVNANLLNTVVDKLLAANKIAFYGSGGSAVIALDAYHKFFRMGLQCNVYNDAHMQVMSASLLSKSDVAIGISHSGSNKDLLDAIQIAKTNGATTVGISNYIRSPLSKEVDYALHTSSKETLFRTEAMASRLGQLSLIDTLFVALSLKLKDQTLENLKKVREAIATKRF